MTMVAAALMLAATLTPEQMTTLPPAAELLWPAAVVAPDSEQVENRKADQNELGLNRSFSQVVNPTVTICRPAPEHNTGLAVVICPGGGFARVVADKEGFDVARWLQSQGITGVVLKYRTVKDWGKNDVSLADAQRAIRLLRARAAELGLRPDRIGIMGFSAGGHLAARAALEFAPGNPDAADPAERQSSRPDFVVLGYPVITPELEAKMRADAPPAFLVHAYDDGIAPDNSIRYFQAAHKLKVPAELMIYAGGGHGFGIGRDKSLAGATWNLRFHDWLKEVKLLP